MGVVTFGEIRLSNAAGPSRLNYRARAVPLLFSITTAFPSRTFVGREYLSKKDLTLDIRYDKRCLW
jgi:hypothetical protein